MMRWAGEGKVNDIGPFTQGAKTSSARNRHVNNNWTIMWGVVTKIHFTMVMEPCGSGVYVIYKFKNVYCQE